MLDSIRDLVHQVSQFDMTHDREYDYKRLWFLVLYKMAHMQMEHLSPSRFHPIFLVIPLEVLKMLKKGTLREFNYYNDHILREIRGEHARILHKIDQLNKMHHDTVPNEQEILLKMYVYRIHNHITEIAVLSEIADLCLHFSRLFTNTFADPLRIAGALWFVDRTWHDVLNLVRNIVSSNAAALRVSDEIDRQVHEFIHKDHNKNIIYECLVEGAYIDRFVHDVEQFYELRKDKFRGYYLSYEFAEFEYRFQQNIMWLSCFLPSTHVLSLTCEEIKGTCRGMAFTLVDYHTNQNALQSLRLENLARIPIAPPKARIPSEHIRKRLSNKVLFRIAPFTHRDDERVLFTVPSTLIIPSMAWVTMLGASGSGKTTLCAMCLKKTNDANRRIFLADTYNNYTYDDIRPHVSYVKSNTDLFDQSIRFNLTFGVTLSAKTQTNRIRKYMAQFGLERLMSKLDSHIKHLSSGEQQRIKLIRCLLHDKPIWVLDEATSNLDSDCEYRVLDVLRTIQRKKGKSVIHVTHNQSLVQYADYVLTFQNQKVAIKARS